LTPAQTGVARFQALWRGRWDIEVTFHDAKQYLGLAEPQCQSPKAVQRTMPFAFVVYDLVLLWAAEQHGDGSVPAWIERPWYRHKTAPSFLDLLTALRLAGWQSAIAASPQAPPRPQKSTASTAASRRRAA
jgi:hypothetical protein